jgi:pyridinium-3,5-bisthiocarboxylic acid mononucleotide nickel chelatase
MRIGYLDCFSGISGDMLLGALVDAGVPLETLAAAATALNVGATLSAKKVMRSGITATKVDVHTGETESASQHEHPHDDSHEHGHPHEHSHPEPHKHGAHRHLSAILKIIDHAPLADRVKERSKSAFQQLGEAEAAIHSIPVEKVHFHEVGAVDTIVDIVCAAVGCEFLAVDRWLASPLNVGSGTVECAHGTLPVPAPATLALLGNAPIYAAGSPMERVTPTGAAILGMLQVEYGVMPAVRVSATGYGAGGRDTADQANVVRLLLGESASADADAGQVAIIETVIDDSSPQLLAYVSDLLLDAGAWDVIRTTVLMKKGRSGVQLQVLCSPANVETLRELIFRETTTIGLHWCIENKVALEREWIEVKTEWGPVRIKVARDAVGSVTNAAPEYEDCRALAGAHSVPLKRVMQAALQAYSTLGKEKH